MANEIKELTLLLLYLTAWEEETFSGSVLRSWKGYRFEILDKLEDDGYISQSKRAKSAWLTEEGRKYAEELKQKYIKKKPDRE